MPSLALKAAATFVTLGAALLSALYVGGHVKSGAAPLHPSVIGARQGIGGRLTLTPSVREADVQPVTSTYAS